jgi:hypothetical protein
VNRRPLGTISDWQQKEGSSMSFIEVLFFVVLLAGIFYLLWSKWQAGSVLLDLGRPESHKQNIRLGIIWMLLGILWLAPELLKLLIEYNSETEIDYSLGLLWLLLGILMLLTGLIHNIIGERGVFLLRERSILFIRFIKWKRISSYEWHGSTLTLRIKHPLPFLQTLSFLIQVHHKDTVDSLLAKYAQGDKTARRRKLWG